MHKDYQLELPLSIEPEVDGAAVPAGYRIAERESGEVFSGEVLEVIPDLTQIILPIFGVAEAFEFRKSQFFMRQIDSPFRSTACTPQEASTLASRARTDSQQSRSDLLALPQEGAQA